MTRYTGLDSRDRRALLTFMSSLTVSGERRKPVANQATRRAGAMAFTGIP
jgi:hypothetical protein